MATSTHTQPDFTSQSGTVYKTAIDDSIAVQKRISAPFAAHEQSTPDMTVRVDAGHVFDGSTLTEVGPQDTGAITAPSTDDRIDRVVVSNVDGTVAVITGTEAASPSAPAITSGNVPVAQVRLTPSTTEITNADITDERSRLPGGVSSGGGNFPNVDADVTATDEELNNADADTAGGGFLIGPTSSTDPGLSLNTWRTPNANRPTLVQVELTTETDGTSAGIILLNVDESGGTSEDYQLTAVIADASAPSGFGITLVTTFFVPAGASYQLSDLNGTFDPTGSNAIEDHREFTL